MNDPKSYFPLDIQLSARAWDDYALSPALVRESHPSAIYALRRLTQELQRQRPRPVSAARLNLLALLNRVFRFISRRHLEARGCVFTADEIELGGRRIQLSGLQPAQEAFVRLFPPGAVIRGERPEDFLPGPEGADNRRRGMVELFILAVQNGNPAIADFLDLFDDGELRRACAYREVLNAVDAELEQEPAEGILGQSLLALLGAPIEAAPHSIADQLAYIQRHWAFLLPPDLLRGILTAFDVLREEQQMRGGEPGAIPVPRFGAGLFYEEAERFSPDADWMSNVVLIAKTIYVWLDQLSKLYGRPIGRLDQIPDEELDRLGRWGFSGLWLIGIWERSPASEKIKKIMGNPEAVASAYSLYDYVVAEDLGGEGALADLQERCRRRGLRLGCDVVPNHTGIYSKWTREHPDWYVQVDHPPYPAYRYTGANLSFSDDIELLVEDGYWNHSDAAVVFKHVDRRDGRVRYIYHGNDGTHLPWNDTAQLNFLIPEVREAMIQTILRVARRHQIIRFDAAMTLAKKHYQRLWFPQPGGGAGVPSRAEHSMSREDFDRAFPVEFWREVVDRVAAEVPDTLLLAEAFWLMEGYFVRTLGMHRVYNSAFMNMLKTEENAKYRSVIKNILDFNPEILKRFVNFMNNPDEATAVAQFGKGDKYFGVAVLLVTMPGLPMFGHGQVEGFEEKYGMEYRRAYREEVPDLPFIRHHEAQVFPLMRRRPLFSGSEHFVLYDFWSGDQVNEDVFAYSNRFAGERSLVAYHNHHGETAGWIRTSTAKKVKNEAGEETVIHPTLGESLAIQGEDRQYVRFRDFRTGLEYLRAGREMHEKGLFLQLGPYRYDVFLDFRDIVDEDGSWGWLCHVLAGRPVTSLDFEWKKIRYAPLIEAFRQAVLPGLLKGLGRLVLRAPAEWADDPTHRTFARQAEAFFRSLRQTAALPGEPEALSRTVLADLPRIARLAALTAGEPGPALAALRPALPAEKAPGRRSAQFFRVLLPWLLLRRLGDLQPAAAAPQRQAAAWLEEFLLIPTLQEILQSEDLKPFRVAEAEAAGEALLVQLLVRHQGAGDRLLPGLPAILADPGAQAYLGCNWYDGTRWFNRESLETLLYWHFVTSAIAAEEKLRQDKGRLADRVAILHQDLTVCLALAERSGYQFDPFVEAVRQAAPTPSAGKS